MKSLLLALLLSLTLAGAFTLDMVPTPAFSEVVHRCMEEQRELEPVSRTQACQCIAETKSTFIWTVRRAVSGTAVDTDDALANTCRARAFSLHPTPLRDPS